MGSPWKENIGQLPLSIGVSLVLDKATALFRV